MDTTVSLILTQILYYIVIFFAIKEVRRLRRLLITSNFTI